MRIMLFIIGLLFIAGCSSDIDFDRETICNKGRVYRVVMQVGTRNSARIREIPELKCVRDIAIEVRKWDGNQPQDKQ